ncbi:MAG TPA: dual specificity protein phosphatase family protein [Nitrososphaerales archaeon]|nr:dual specificity protein phosphatase family protein [Nitrososphaerales archaeon]
MFEKQQAARRIFGFLTGRPMNFSFIDEFVSGSACPMSKREVDWLRKKKGIKAVLSLTEVPIKAEWVEGFDYKNVPIRDHSIPTLAQLQESVNFVVSQAEMKHPLVVHCTAGKGRTGTVLASYKCQKYRLTAKESIEQLRLKRPGSVERRQVTIIETFCQSFME